MRLAASATAVMVLVLATIGFFTSGGTAHAQLGKSDTAPAPAAEPVRALLQVDAPAGKEAPDALWQRTINTHAALLHEPGLLRAVVASDEVHKTGWYAQFKGDNADAKAAVALARSLAVRPVQDTALIEVRPIVEPAADAAVIANAVCEQYVAKRTEEQHASLNRENDLLQRQLNSVKLELNEDVIKQEHQSRQELALQGIVLSAAPDAVPAFSAPLLELQEVVRARLTAETELETAKRAVDVAALQGAAAPKAALKDAEERVKQLTERQQSLQTSLAKGAQAIYQLRLLNEREAELRRQQFRLSEQISNLVQIALQRPGTDVRIAARATPTP
jgi:hypothetical protein